MPRPLCVNPAPGVACLARAYNALQAELVQSLVQCPCTALGVAALALVPCQPAAALCSCSSSAHSILLRFARMRRQLCALAVTEKCMWLQEQLCELQQHMEEERAEAALRHTQLAGNLEYARSLSLQSQKMVESAEAQLDIVNAKMARLQAEVRTPAQVGGEAVHRDQRCR
jgi:hypothetical protein